MIENIPNTPPMVIGESDILILGWNFSGNDADINTGSSRDQELVEALKKYLDKLAESAPDIEVFCIRGNIAATSSGFLGAFRRSELDKDIKSYTV